jgi:hypothetical protein
LFKSGGNRRDWGIRPPVVPGFSSPATKPRKMGTSRTSRKTQSGHRPIGNYDVPLPATVVCRGTARLLAYVYFEDEGGDDPQPSCSVRMRREGSQSTSRSCQIHFWGSKAPAALDCHTARPARNVSPTGLLCHNRRAGNGYEYAGRSGPGHQHPHSHVWPVPLHRVSCPERKGKPKR